MDKLFLIIFADGTSTQEYGSSVCDVRQFLIRIGVKKPITSITLENP